MERTDQVTGATDLRMCQTGLLECAQKLQQWSVVAREAHKALQGDHSRLSQFEKSRLRDYYCVGCMNASVNIAAENLGDTDYVRIMSR
jgi:hypothetical protein